MWLLSALSLLPAPSFQQAAVDPSPPNIVLMMADDLGWGDVGFNGGEIIQTPQLDAMAAGGLVFDRFYAAAPVCSPTRGSALTGRHPYRYGVFNANSGHLLPRELTLAEALRTLGYATGHFGKWHLGTLTTTESDANRGGPKHAAHYSPPWENGFDVCFSTESKVPTFDPMLRPAESSQKKQNQWWPPVEDPESATAYGTAYWSNGERVTGDLRGDDSRLIMDRALPFIRAAVNRKQPFFSVIWFHAPHLPVVADEEHTRPYAEHPPYAQHYYGCITALDEQIGRLRRDLRELGVEENTLIFFCSDNGPEGDASAPGSTGGLRGRKRSLHEGGIRVPALAEWPARIEAGRRTSLPSVTSDYLPTILAAVGLEVAPGTPLDGINLMPLLAGQLERREEAIAFESGRQLALVRGRYKLVGRLVRAGNEGELEPLDPERFQLFDLREDRAEEHDLAEAEEDLLAELTLELDVWRRSCRASLRGGDQDTEPVEATR
jgi:arylsulfatase A-like enzyme